MHLYSIGLCTVKNKWIDLHQTIVTVTEPVSWKQNRIWILILCLARSRSILAKLQTLNIFLLTISYLQLACFEHASVKGWSKTIWRGIVATWLLAGKQTHAVYSSLLTALVILVSVPLFISVIFSQVKICSLFRRRNQFVVDSISLWTIFPWMFPS